MEVQGVGAWVCVYMCVCMYTVAHRVNPIYFAKIRLLQIKML